MSLLLDDELAAPRPDLDPQIVLDNPDHPVRSFYDYTVSINGPNDTEDGLAPEVLDYLDERSRAGANLAFHINYAQYPMSGGLPWKSWEEIVTEVGWLQEAAADRFLDIVYEVGDTGPSSSVLPGGYAFVDGLAVHGEPFLLEERTPGEWEAFAVSPPIQLVPDHEASDPSQWQAATLAGCEGWTYDPSVGHNTPGSWRLDADGSGNCATLTSDLDPTSIRDGRHLLATRLRSDSAGDHLGPFGTGYAQLSVYLTFDDGSVQSEHLAISSALGVSSPTATNHDGSDWFELYHTFVFDHEAQGLTVTDAYVYARSQTGVGTVWFDEVSLERIDGGFRNVAGGIQPPLVTSSDGGTVFVEGQDYTVCQVGEDLGVYTEICSSNLNDDNYETVFWARYWGGSLRYGYEPRYSRVLEPFRLIWLDDTTRPADDTILVSYDINLAYQSQTGTPGTPHVGQRYNFCDVDTLFDELAWGDAYDRVLGTGVDQLGAKHIRVGLSEVRGVNRSRICQAWVEENGSWSWQPTASNAARFADMANRLIDEAHLRDPDVMVFLWDDMLNPFDNGGNPNYQQTFGGPPGPSACALAPLSNPSLCSEIDDVDPISGDTVMIQWNYVVDGLWQTAAVAQWYDSVQQPWLIGPGGDALVAEDRAAIAHSSSEILGVSAFHFKNGDVPEQLRTFWNHDWRLMYLVDFETDASSHLPIDGPSLVVTVGEVTESSDGTCASHSATTGSTWEGNSDGGLCLDPATGMQGTVDAVAASGGLLHRAGLHIRVDSDTVPIQVPNLRFHYEQVDGSVLTSAWLPTIEVATLADGFDRYETAPPGVMAPEATVAVSVEIEVFPGVDAIDNLLFQQALPPCFDAC